MRHEGKRYQLDQQHEAMSLAGRKVLVRVLRDGTVQLERKGQKLKWRAVARRAERAGTGTAQKTAAKAERKAEEQPARRKNMPAATHPVVGKQQATKGTFSGEFLRGHF